MKIKHICFDLDGTLIDSRTTIYKSTVAVLQKLKIDYHFPADEFTNMIGLHFNDIFSHFKVDVPDFEEFIKVYKRLYFDFIDESRLYPFVDEVLYRISSSGAKTSLLTTKGQDQAERIVEHFDLRKNLTYVMGRRNGIAHKPAAEPLLLICDELKVQPEETLIVGDTELDIQCGKNAGAKTCGVLYGYRTEKQIRNENPDYILKGMNELINIL